MNEPTAIIGIAVHLPDAGTLAELHANLAGGRDSVRTVPETRLRMAGADPATRHQLLAPIDRVAEFDHEFFGVSLREAELMDPHHRLTLQLACAAVADAGYALGDIRGSRSGVVLTGVRPDYDRLIDDADDGLLAMLGNAPAALAGRIAYLLGAQGPALVLDTGCSSGLVAVDHAHRLLRAGDAEAVLVGGLSVRSTFTPSTDSERYAEVMAADGRCRAFDADADGTADGEGGVMLLLKPLASALRDRDHIHALVRGSAVNHNGYRSSSLSAPSPAAQREVLRAAWRQAGIDPAALGYVEAHGSGTRLGDLIEAEALHQALTADGPRAEPCPIGSVKTNLGHLDHAAGLAGLAKAVLSLRHGTLYPSLHFDRPNPLIDFDTKSIRVNSALRPWPRTGDARRLAGVTSLSITGTNAHVVLEEPPAPPPRPAAGTEQGIVTVSARSRRALARYCERLAAHASAHPDLRLGDVLHVLNRGRDHYPYRVAFPAASLADVATGLRRAARRLGRGLPAEDDTAARRIVLGVSAGPDLAEADAARLADAHPEFAAALRRCRDAAPPGGPPGWFARRYALWCLLAAGGLRPDQVVGGGAALPLARVVRGETSLADGLAAAVADPHFSRTGTGHETETVRLDGPVAVCELGPTTGPWPGLPPGAVAVGVRGDGALRSLAELYAAGAELDWKRAHRDCGHVRVPLPTPPFDPAVCWCREFDDAAPAPPPAAGTRPVSAPVPASVPDPARAPAPRTREECGRVLARVWQDALKSPGVGEDSDYFALGGNSIVGLQVVASVWRELGVRVRLPDLYSHPTVRALAAVVHARLLDATGAARDRIAPVARGPRPPLSFGQESLWFVDRLQPASWAYNVPLNLHVLGPVDHAALQAALRALTERHEVLRTRYADDEGRPYLVLDPPDRLTLRVRDLRRLAQTERDREADRLLQAEAREPFDLAAGPLFRALLIRLQEERHCLVLTAQHSVDDGWSPPLLRRDLWELYAAHREGRAPRLPELPIQYADFAAWQREHMTGPRHAAELAFWTERLHGCTPLELPTDHARPARQTGAGAHHFFTIPGELVDRLRQLAAAERVTLFTVMVAGLQTLLHRLSGQDDVTIGTFTAGRNRPETHDLFGYFNNALALRGDLGGDPSFRTLLGRVRGVVVDALDHDELPFADIVAALQPVRDLSRHPVFQVGYTHQTIPAMDEYPLPGGLRLDEERGSVLRGLPPGITKWDLDFGVWEVEGEAEMEAVLEYSTDLFEEETAVAMARSLVTLLSGIAEDPDRTLGELPLATGAEIASTVADSAGAAWAAGPGTVLDGLAGAVAGHPGRRAVAHAGHELDYAGLAARVDRIAAALRARGAEPGNVVGVLLPRGVDLPVALLAVLSSGAAFLPLDPEHPPRRLRFMAEDARPAVVVTTAALADRLPAAVPVLLVEEAAAAPPAAAGGAAARAPGPDDIAYVLYTSGSTGTPKGVAVSHRSLEYYRRVWLRAAGGGGLTWLSMASAAFDVFAGDLVRSVCSGGTLVLAPDDVWSSSRALHRLICELRVQAVEFVPGLVRARLIEYVTEHGLSLDSLRLVINGTHVWAMEETREVAAALGEGARVVTVFGVTEATIDSSLFDATASSLPDRDPVPVGRPFPGTELYVLDELLRPVPPGVEGELYIGGAGLAAGYVRRPALTAGRFVPDPFSGRPGARLYRTGDRARRPADGELRFLGRLDDQVKINGQRIEPGEVEAALRDHPGVLEALAGAQAAPTGDRRLVAHVLPAPAGRPPTAGELRGWLRERLPAHLVPAALTVVDALPYSPNGKLDRAAWQRGRAGPPAGERDRTAPSDAVELRLLRVWERVLGVSGIGVSESFFEVGGHSILGVRLLDAVERELGATLTLAQLFHDPTVEGLAAAVRRENGAAPAAPRGCLLAIRTGGTRPPLYCVHPSGGGVHHYYRFAHALDAEQPVYGFQAAGLDDGTPPDPTVERMAARYVAELRAHRPVGPYRLLGWSLGGVVAYEMARQLAAAGGPPDLLVVVDADAAEAYEPPPPDDEAMLRLLLRANAGFTVPEDRLAGLTGPERLESVLELARLSGALPRQMPLSRVRRMARALRDTDAALARYRIGPYDGPVHVLRAADAGAGRPPDLGWGGHADEVRATVVPGGHYDLFDRHHAALAEAVGEIVAGLPAPAAPATEGEPASR